MELVLNYVCVVAVNTKIEITQTLKILPKIKVILANVKVRFNCLFEGYPNRAI